METLKTLREKHNLSQTVIGTYIKLPASQISLFENGQTLPDLEDCLILEKQFGERIQWDEKLTPARKFEVVQAIIDLSQRYPIEMTLEFASRMYRRESYPDT
ncbi:MAG: helix-turn-helix transcriptional regulator, partial [Bacteroidales bacterium]